MASHRRDASEEGREGPALTKWSLSQAPPTDAELKQIGLGFHTAPPPSLKDQINAQVLLVYYCNYYRHPHHHHLQVESIKTGRTPRRVNPQAPAEVKMALAYAKVEVERLRTSPKNEEEGRGGVNLHTKTGPPVFPLSSVTADLHSHSNSNSHSHSNGNSNSNSNSNSNGNRYENRYSIGGSLPRGVAWRYVDVLGEDGRVHQSVG